MTTVASKSEWGKWSPERIKKLRKRLKMTHDQFAKALGVSLRTVMRWQVGHSPPRGLSFSVLDGLAAKAKKP